MLGRRAIAGPDVAELVGAERKRPARRRQRRRHGARLPRADERLEQQPYGRERSERAMQPADMRPRRSHGPLETGGTATVKAEMRRVAGPAPKSPDCRGAVTVEAEPNGRTAPLHG